VGERKALRSLCLFVQQVYGLDVMVDLPDDAERPGDGDSQENASRRKATDNNVNNNKNTD
jgi:hypothetical protein